MKGAAIVIWLGLAGVAGFALFSITFKVEQLEDELSARNKEILREQKAVHVLRAEWSYLNRPDRIEALVRKLLPDLRAPSADQIGDLDSLNEAPLTAQGPSHGAAEAIRPASTRSGQ